MGRGRESAFVDFLLLDIEVGGYGRVEVRRRASCRTHPRKDLASCDDAVLLVCRCGRRGPVTAARTLVLGHSR